MGTMLRALVSTALVLGLIWYLSRVVRKPGALTSRLKLPTTGSIIVSRSSVNRTTTLVVVRFGGKEHLIAANESSAQVLATSDLDPAPTTQDTTPQDPQLEALQNTLKPTTFADVLRGYTARRAVEQL